MGDPRRRSQPLSGSDVQSGDAGAALEAFARRVSEQPSLRTLDAAAIEVIDALAAADVEVLLLKGPALARTLYREGEHRGYSDVDLLVSPAGLPAARRVLEGLRYVNVIEGLGIVDVGGGALDAETWVETQRPGSVASIDLHWRLPGSEAPPEAVWGALSRHPGWVELGGRRVATLSHEGLALHVATHAAQHGTRYGRPIEDLNLALERWPLEIWRDAQRLATEIEATPPFAAGLRLVPAGAVLADELELPAADELLWAIANRDRRPRGTFHLDAFKHAPNARERLRLVRRSLFPTPEWIAWQYPWARSTGARLIAARALHVMRAPVWAAKAWRFRRQARSAK